MLNFFFFRKFLQKHRKVLHWFCAITHFEKGIWRFELFTNIFFSILLLNKKCSKTASFFNSTNGGAFRFCLAWLFGLTRIFTALKWLIFILRSHVRGKMCATTQYRNWVNCYWKNFMLMSFDGAIGFQSQEDWYTTWNDGRENLWIAWTLIIHVWWLLFNRKTKGMKINAREGRKLMKNHVPWQYSKEDIVHYAPTASLHQVRPIDNALLQAQLPP